MEEQKYEYMVSISCITFNHEPYIRKALDGFLMQKTNFPFEIVIHDDASTDRTADIIREYQKKYPEIIHPLYQTENQYSKGIANISGKFNFPRVKGKYIAMCEGDDYWIDENKLQKQFDYMENHRDCALCFHAALTESQDRALRQNKIRPYQQNKICSPADVIDKRENYPTASLFFRSADVSPLPEYYFNCPVGDIPLHIHLMEFGSGYYIDQYMSVYRQGVSVSWSEQMLRGNYEENLRAHHNKMKEMFQAYEQQNNYIHHKAVESAIMRMDFLTELNVKHYREAKDAKYARYYKELPLYTRMLIDLELKAPWLYEGLRKIWYQRPNLKVRK